MVTLYAPVRVLPTPEAAKALSPAQLADAGRYAYKAIAAAGQGMEVSHLQFTFDRIVFAVCSRYRLSGVMEIELGFGDRRLPVQAIPAPQQGHRKQRR